MKIGHMVNALIVAAMTMFLHTSSIAQTYTDLYNFQGPQSSYNTYPAVLAQGPNGNLFGTVPTGGINGYGMVFEIAPKGQLKPLYQFDGGIHGGNPVSGLTLGTDGDLYGTTLTGGNASNCGTIFKITQRGQLTTLYAFMCSHDGGLPFAPPVEGNNRSFYGTTNLGTSYEITPSGAFKSFGHLPNRSASSAALLLANDGNFYGSTGDGGSNGYGTVFKLTRKGDVKVIHNFDGIHGDMPFGVLIQAADGDLYGTTQAGGNVGDSQCPYRCGTVFKISPTGTFTTIYAFCPQTPCTDGSVPLAGLTQTTDGSFYGVTSAGGKGFGVMFRISPTGEYTVVYDFLNASGSQPLSAILQHTSGVLYGQTWSGGDTNGGVVYSEDVGLAPFVSLTFAAGRVGQTGGILGQGLTGTTAVAFNGTSAAFTIKSDTLLVATVPPGATTGYVTVTTPTGTLKSNKKFVVLP